jgi:peptidoglycan/LPS O-acetylase OafA/YrhL
LEVFDGIERVDRTDKRRVGTTALALVGVGAILAVFSIFVQDNDWLLLIGGLVVLGGFVFYVASLMAE